MSAQTSHDETNLIAAGGFNIHENLSSFFSKLRPHFRQLLKLHSETT